MSEKTKLQRLADISAAACQGKKMRVPGESLSQSIHKAVSKVLGATNVLQTKGGVGIESYEEAVSLNRNFDVEQNFPADKLIDELKALNVPDRVVPGIVTDVMRTLDGQTSAKQIVSDMPSGNYGSLSDLTGRSAVSGLTNESLGTEAWGEDIDGLASDERVTCELLIMRPFSSMADKAFARVPVDNNVITVRVPSPEVYDWMKTQTGLTTVLDSESNRIIMRDLYRDPSTVSSEPRPLVPQAAADANKVLWNNTTYLSINKSANILQLCMIANTFGYDHRDRSDLISEGGKIDSVILSLSNGTTTEYVKVETGPFKRSGYVPNPTGGDSGDRQVIMPFYVTLTKGATLYDGTTSTLAAPFTDSTVKVRVDLSSTLSLKFGRINANASVETSIVPNAVGGTPSDEENTAFQGLTVSVVAYAPALQYDEENFRKSNLAIWVNYNQNQYVIPRSRNYFTEYALNQELDSNAVQATSDIMTLGNSNRSIYILANALNDVAAAVSYANTNAVTASVNQLDETSFVSTLVKPLVLTTTIDFGAEPVNVMNESTRPHELTGRFRARVMSMLAELMAKTLMVNQYKAGEPVVLKAFAYSAIADVLIGVLNYQPNSNEMATTANGADFSMTLPNGARLDVIKSTFDCLANRVIIVPVRESNGADLTSAAQIVDRGTASAIYAPTNYGATVKRVVSTTREILMVTNPIGLIIKIANIGTQFGTFDSTPIALAPSTNSYSALANANG